MNIKINLKIFLFAIMFYFTKQIQIYAMLMLFGIIHELGHLICGLFLGLKPKSLKVMPLGFAIEFKLPVDYYNKKIRRGNLMQLKKLIIALAGPITNFSIVAGCLIIKTKYNIEYILYSNLLIGLFNLLPIYPLDGGRCIKNILHIVKGKRVSLEYTNKIANLCIVTLTAISSIVIYRYKNIAILLIIIYLWGLVINENRKYNTKMKAYKMIDTYVRVDNISELVEMDSAHIMKK